MQWTYDNASILDLVINLEMKQLKIYNSVSCTRHLTAQFRLQISSGSHFIQRDVKDFFGISINKTETDTLHAHVHVHYRSCLDVKFKLLILFDLEVFLLVLDNQFSEIVVCFDFYFELLAVALQVF